MKPKVTAVAFAVAFALVGLLLVASVVSVLIARSRPGCDVSVGYANYVSMNLYSDLWLRADRHAAFSDADVTPELLHKITGELLQNYVGYPPECVRVSVPRDFVASMRLLKADESRRHSPAVVVEVRDSTESAWEVLYVLSHNGIAMPIDTVAHDELSDATEWAQSQ